MHKLWERSSGYSLLRFYADLCTCHCYRRIRVEGKEKLPSDGAVLLASNHCCTMMDPMVMLHAGKRATAFGARADIFRKPRINNVLRWLRMVPLARERDGKTAVTGNQQTFEEIVECLDNSVPFCLYCEGTHRPQRLIQRPLKKGVFRLAEMAKDTTNKKVYIVPVGLNYSNFFRYMENVTVKYGDPILIDDIESLTPMEKVDFLGDKLQSLVDIEEPKRRHGRLITRFLVSLISLPLFVLCAVASSPILLLTLWFLRNVKDKAWYNTVRFACSFPFFILWPFHSMFYLLLNYYDDLIIDFKKK